LGGVKDQEGERWRREKGLARTQLFDHRETGNKSILEVGNFGEEFMEYYSTPEFAGRATYTKAIEKGKREKTK